MFRSKRSNHKNTWTDAEVEAHWDAVADIYVNENNKVKDTHDQRFKETIQYLNLIDGNIILNITSRDGEATDYVLNEGSEVSVINAEISEGLIKVAQRLRPYLKQVKLDNYSKLPFKSESFDRIISLETLEHVSDPIAFLNELHRVSTKEARLVLSCPPATSEWPYQIYTAIFGGHGEGPHRFPSSKEVKSMLIKTKWKLLMHKGTLLIPVGPKSIKKFSEKLIDRMQGTIVSELGIRQFYVCEKY